MFITKDWYISMFVGYIENINHRNKIKIYQN
jgi:hypothetical protein